MCIASVSMETKNGPGDYLNDTLSWLGNFFGFDQSPWRGFCGKKNSGPILVFVLTLGHTRQSQKLLGNSIWKMLRLLKASRVCYCKISKQSINL